MYSISSSPPSNQDFLRTTEADSKIYTLKNIYTLKYIYTLKKKGKITRIFFKRRVMRWHSTFRYENIL